MSVEVIDTRIYPRFLLLTNPSVAPSSAGASGSLASRILGTQVFGAPLRTMTGVVSLHGSCRMSRRSRLYKCNVLVNITQTTGTELRDARTPISMPCAVPPSPCCIRIPLSCRKCDVFTFISPGFQYSEFTVSLKMTIAMEFSYANIWLRLGMHWSFWDDFEN